MLQLRYEKILSVLILVVILIVALFLRENNRLVRLVDDKVAVHVDRLLEDPEEYRSRTFYGDLVEMHEYFEENSENFDIKDLNIEITNRYIDKDSQEEGGAYDFWIREGEIVGNDKVERIPFTIRFIRGKSIHDSSEISFYDFSLTK